MAAVRTAAQRMVKAVRIAVDVDTEKALVARVAARNGMRAIGF
jgi:hypothetical protein